MRRTIGVCLMLLAAGLLPDAAAYGQDYELPPGTRTGVQTEAEYRGTGRSTFSALKVGQGARATGMGDAFAAVANDINAIFWNESGLTHVKRFEYTLNYTRWLVNGRFFSGALAWRVGQQTLGLSLVQFDAGASRETTPLDPLGQAGNKVNAGDVFLKASYARRMTDKLSLGASVKWIQETLHEDRITSASFNFSSLFYTGLGNSRIAMTLQNFGKDQELLVPGSIGSGASIAQPLVYTIALAMEPIGQLGLPYSLTVAGELTHHIDDRERYQAGAEFWVQNTVALRAGYRWRYDVGDWSLGAGVQRDLGAGRRVGVDISYLNGGDLFSAPLRVSLAGAF